MTFDRHRSVYILAGGREFHADEIIGIRDDDRGYIYSGYDDSTCVDGTQDPEDNPEWTTEERAELADEMIARWERFKRPEATG